MVAKSGDSLLREDAVTALRGLLLPLCVVVTPNLPEAEVLSGRSIDSDDDVRRAAEEIVGLGAGAVVVKGGHREGAEAVDVLYDGTAFREYSASRIDTTSTHGTGCTFASAIAAYLARGEPLPEAVGLAKEYLTEALRRAYPVGGGHGPVHHFHRWWEG
jgi:hydroxymethylpyrimidine/phosphomethylpyrimidine kinase